MKPKAYRFRRLLAKAIDWNLCCLPGFLACGLLFPSVAEGKLPIPLLIPFMVSFLVLFPFLDRLFRGRSPGNRLMKLVVLDRRNLQPLSTSALTTRNVLFLFLSGLDILLLLTTGATLGDRAVGAIVVHQNGNPADLSYHEPANRKSILVTVLAVAAGFVLLLGVVFFALESVKDEPHYAMAYSYLLESETFARLDAEPDNVRLSGYSQSTTIQNGIRETQASFTFQIGRHQLVVVCHQDGENWYVCEECTPWR